MILPPLAAVLVSILLTLPFTLGDDGLGVLYLFTIGPWLFLVVSSPWLILAATATGPRQLGLAMSFLLLFPIPVAAIAFRDTALIATHDAEDLIAWYSRDQKYRVSGQMTTGLGLPHAVWRQWGFLSVWTEAYLVFDKADALASFAFRGGDVPGLQCAVWHVLPLEKQWYVVTLYSEQTWDMCS